MTFSLKLPAPEEASCLLKVRQHIFGLKKVNDAPADASFLKRFYSDWNIKGVGTICKGGEGERGREGQLFFMIWSYGIGSKECVVMWHIDGRCKGVECQKSRRWKQFGLIWAKHLAGSPQTAQSWHLHLQEARKQGIGPHSTSPSNPIPQHKHRYYNRYISIEQISFLFSIDEKKKNVLKNFLLMP